MNRYEVTILHTQKQVVVVDAETMHDATIAVLNGHGEVFSTQTMAPKADAPKRLYSGENANEC